MKKILIIIALLSFIISQDLGMIKTRKNKSGLAFIINANYIYKIDKTGKNILYKPEDLDLQICYKMKSDIELFSGFSPGEIIYYNSSKIQKYNRYNYGIAYHFYQKKWGASLNVEKKGWQSDSINEEFKNHIERLGQTGITISIYARIPLHPFLSYTNYFMDHEEEVSSIYSNERIVIGGITQINKFLLKLGMIMPLQKEWRVYNEDASFYIGCGYEFF